MGKVSPAVFPYQLVISADATIAPRHCAIKYGKKSFLSILPPMAMVTVTAGLKCPPDTFPKAYAITMMAKPWANATPSRVASFAMAPVPAKTKVKAPMNTAIHLLM